MKIAPGWWRNCPGYIWKSVSSWERPQKLHFDFPNVIFWLSGTFNLQFRSLERLYMDHQTKMYLYGQPWDGGGPRGRTLHYYITLDHPKVEVALPSFSRRRIWHHHLTMQIYIQLYALYHGGGIPIRCVHDMCMYMYAGRICIRTSEHIYIYISFLHTLVLRSSAHRAWLVVSSIMWNLPGYASCCTR